MSKLQGPASDLRARVDRLPLETRQAMLEGMEANRIITGRYADRGGGVCPVFAAHRTKGLRDGMARVRSAWACFLHMRSRPRVEVSFAKAWDYYARRRTGKGPRPATDSELVALRAMLQASIDRDTGGGAEQLSEASTGQAAATARPAPERWVNRLSPPDSGERNRMHELSGAEGWAWLRLYRRYDEYEDALRELEETERERADRVGGQPAELPSAEELEHRSPVAS
jgi:hypothetical protein